MAVEIAALASKAGAVALAYGPTILEAAIRLYQGARNAEPEMAVAGMLTHDGSEIDGAKISAAVKDIERSLLTLNGQVTEASLLLAKIAESNAALTEEVRRQRAWLLVLSVMAGVSVALSVMAVFINLL